MRDFDEWFNDNVAELENAFAEKYSDLFADFCEQEYADMCGHYADVAYDQMRDDDST